MENSDFFVIDLTLQLTLNRIRKTEKIMSLKFIVVTAISFCLATITLPVLAAPNIDKIRQCVEKKKAAFIDTKPFSSKNRVDCPQSDIYTSLSHPLPECRTNRASKQVRYEAPQGRRIVGEIKSDPVSVNKGGSVSDIQRERNNNGDITAAYVAVSCESPPVCPGGPGSFSEYQISGSTQNAFNEDNIFAWTVECTAEQ